MLKKKNKKSYNKLQLLCGLDGHDVQTDVNNCKTLPSGSLKCLLGMSSEVVN